MSLFFEQGVLSEKFLKEIRADLREHLPVQAGLEYRFGDEDGNDTGAKRFSVTLFGEDTELLTSLSDEAQRRIEAIEGVSDVTSGADQGHPEIQVTVDQTRANRHGVRAASISQILALTYRGTRLPRLNTGEKEIDLSISLLPDDAESIENLATTVISIEDGAPVLLSQVADFEFRRSPQRIERQNQKTGLTLNGSYDGERLDEGLEKIAGVMKAMEMPFGYSWSFGRKIQEAQQERDEMGANLLLALFCVFVVMASLFESFLHPIIVMVCVPFAVVGVFWLMMATGTPFNMMAMIGMVILIGVVVNNGIVLVDHINHHRRVGLSIEDAIVAGCSERIRPILMTAGTTIIGLLPLAVVQGAHVGNGEYYPMARAIIGGLLSSTLLTLIILPTYYRIANNWAANLSSSFRRRTSRSSSPDAKLAATPLAGRPRP
jgi:HAE1 family hydrophobic/amphiphilic exporter-1